MISNDEKEDRKKPPFGTRFLTNESELFQHNAWDNVEWTENQIKEAEETIKANAIEVVDAELKKKYLENGDQFWDQFYNIHQNKFFKDRNWLFTEFSELLDDKVQTIFEIGCGVGNTVFPILTTKLSSDLFIYCCDFSSVAIDILKCQNLYNERHCKAFVCDITRDPLFLPFQQESLDAVVCIFTLSAIKPDKLSIVLKNLVQHLKPGGLLLFRDYGRYDMAQMRFKKGHLLEDNYYVRGDGTTAYFFTPEEVDKMFTAAGLVKKSLITDKRLQVNRGKQLKMYRVWIQAKYVKAG